MYETIKEYNEIVKKAEHYEQEFDKKLSSLKDMTAFHIDRVLLSKKMNTIVKQILLDLDNKKQFKIGKTQLIDRSKIFVREDGYVMWRPYRGKYLRDYSWCRGGLGVSSPQSMVNQVMPEKFQEAYRRITEIVDRSKRDRDEEFWERDYRGQRIGKKLLVGLIDRPFFYLYKDYDQIKIKKAKKADIRANISRYGDTIKFELVADLGGETQTLSSSSVKLSYADEAFRDVMTEAIEQIKKWKEKKTGENKQAEAEIDQIINDAGYNLYLALEEI